MFRWLSGEFLLGWKANGGTVVLLRSVWIAVLGFLFTVFLREILDPRSIWGFSFQSLREALHSGLPVAGAIFAGAYAALYARFASQWSYLAGVYNQIMAAKLRPIEGQDAQLALNRWQAGFVADAEELHLARKPMFASVILTMLAHEGVRAAYVDANGEAALRDLEKHLNRVMAIRPPATPTQAGTSPVGPGSPNSR